MAGPLAVLATAGTVGMGVLATSPEVRENLVASSSQTSVIDLAEREQQVVTRSSRREIVDLQKQFDVSMDRTATMRAVRGADTRLWSTVDLNLWTGPDRKAQKVGLLESGERILVTGRRTPERVEIVWKGESRWVTAGYLAEKKPRIGPTGGGRSTTPAASVPAAAASCTNGTAVPSGVSPNVVAVHEAVCANFPEITTYGTFRGDGEHAQGIAVDIMVSGSRGWEVAEYLRANYADLGVSYLIYSQRIWSVERGGEGWRYMEDRGSTTANHYDHVHVTTY